MSAHDVRILGSGIVSRALALLLAQQGLRVALQLRPAGATKQADVRAYALNPRSVALLERLKAWQALPSDARTAVLDMRIFGDAHGAELDFSAWRQGVSALAWIVDAMSLEEALEAAARFSPAITLQGEPEAAALTVVAEGKHSAGRASLGVAFERHDYGHRAVAARLAAAQPHCGLALQWFCAPSILALLPFGRPQPERSYGLVWSLPDAEALQWLAADVPAFEQGLFAATGGRVGRLSLAGERMSWPLAVGAAEAVAGAGWALIGDAAHQIHPLAGQGLNLGLADAETLSEVIRAREPWRNLGDAALLQRYARRRAAPNLAMTLATDGLWQLFANESAPLRELRNAGMGLVNRLSPLRRWLAGRALDV